MCVNNVFHTSCLHHFQKGRDYYKRGVWLRWPPGVSSDLNFPCDPLAMRNGLGFIFFLQASTGRSFHHFWKSFQKPYLLFLRLWCRQGIDGQLAEVLFLTPVTSGLALVFVSPKSDSNPVQANGKNPSSLTDTKLPLLNGHNFVNISSFWSAGKLSSNRGFNDGYTGIHKHISSCWCYPDDVLCCTITTYFGTDTVPIAHNLLYLPSTLSFSWALAGLCLFAFICCPLVFALIWLYLFGCSLALLPKFVYFNAARILSCQGCPQPPWRLPFIIFRKTK